MPIIFDMILQLSPSTLDEGKGGGETLRCL